MIESLFANLLAWLFLVTLQKPEIIVVFFNLRTQVTQPLRLLLLLAVKHEHVLSHPKSISLQLRSAWVTFIQRLRVVTVQNLGGIRTFAFQQKLAVELALKRRLEYIGLSGHLLAVGGRLGILVFVLLDSEVAFVEEEDGADRQEVINQGHCHEVDRVAIVYS